MVYMLLLTQLLVPAHTTFAEWRVESLPQGKHDMGPLNQEGATSNGNLSHPPTRRAKLMSINQHLFKNLYTAGFCAAVL